MRVGSEQFLRLACWFAVLLVAQPPVALAVRPFITDDARIAKKGQLEDETFGGPSMIRGEKPTIRIGSLEALSLTPHFELTAGLFGLQYHDGEVRLRDVALQPKVLLYQSFGPIPSVSASAGVLLPASGNEQLWDQYAMMQVSWFLFRPEKERHPYDHWLALHLNAGAKARYRAGSPDYAVKPYWAAGFEIGTLLKDLRFISEAYNGDYFHFEQEFPALSSGFRWYHSDGNFQVDVVWRGVRIRGGGHEDERRWEHIVEVGFRFLFSIF